VRIEFGKLRENLDNGRKNKISNSDVCNIWILLRFETRSQCNKVLRICRTVLGILGGGLDRIVHTARNALSYANKGDALEFGFFMSWWFFFYSLRLCCLQYFAKSSLDRGFLHRDFLVGFLVNRGLDNIFFKDSSTRTTPFIDSP